MEEPVTHGAEERSEVQLDAEEDREVLPGASESDEGENVLVEENLERSVEEELSDTHAGEESNSTEREESSGDGNSEEEEVEPLRRSSRIVKPRSVFTFNQVGGQPSYVVRDSSVT